MHDMVRLEMTPTALTRTPNEVSECSSSPTSPP